LDAGPGSSALLTLFPPNSPPSSSPKLLEVVQLAPLLGAGANLVTLLATPALNRTDSPFYFFARMILARALLGLRAEFLLAFDRAAPKGSKVPLEELGRLMRMPDGSRVRRFVEDMGFEVRAGEAGEGEVAVMRPAGGARMPEKKKAVVGVLGEGTRDDEFVLGGLCGRVAEREDSDGLRLWDQGFVRWLLMEEAGWEGLGLEEAV
jgi:hypothetical protein